MNELLLNKRGLIEQASVVTAPSSLVSLLMAVNRVTKRVGKHAPSARALPNLLLETICSVCRESNLGTYPRSLELRSCVV